MERGGDVGHFLALSIWVAWDTVTLDKIDGSFDDDDEVEDLGRQVQSGGGQNGNI